MAINTTIFQDLTTLLVKTYRNPAHTFGTDLDPESWVSYGDLVPQVLGLISQLGDIPSSPEDLSVNDAGRLKATLSNELQLAEKHAEAVIAAQCHFLQAVAEAAVDAIVEVGDAFKDAPAEDDAPVAEDEPAAPSEDAPAEKEDEPEHEDAPIGEGFPAAPEVPVESDEPVVPTTVEDAPSGGDGSQGTELPAAPESDPEAPPAPEETPVVSEATPDIAPEPPSEEKKDEEPTL